MKIGIVKHLNARPLTYGFEKSGKYELYYENPSILKEELLNGSLDLALISSVECIRNRDKLDFSLSTGVCASKKVRSILYFENIQSPSTPRIFVDSGSRSSVALLKILFYTKYGVVPETIPYPPEKIQMDIDSGFGSHLLFGDNALLSTYDGNKYKVYDLAEWWNHITNLNFIFALWAYPKGKKIDEQLFYSSLEFGLQNLDEIITSEKRFSRDMIKIYLGTELHYVVTGADRKGFELFSEKCTNLGLIP